MDQAHLADLRMEFERALGRFLAARATPVALYGAGRLARDLSPLFGTPAGLIDCIIDDDPAKHGKVWCGLEVVSIETAASRGVKGVVITANRPAQDALWERRGAMRDAGMYVLTCPARFESKTWDECLIDQMEAAMATAVGGVGGKPLHIHAYPPVEHKASAALREVYTGVAKQGATVCEIGPGSGLITEFLLPRAAKYYAVDYSERLLYEAIEHRFWKHRRAMTLVHDETASLAGVPDSSCDAVVSHDVFVHVKIDVVHQYLAAIRRVLRPGGVGLIHFVKWDAWAIEEYERVDRGTYRGKPNYYEYLHEDQLAASCQKLELKLEVFQNSAADPRWFMRVSRA